MSAPKSPENLVPYPPLRYPLLDAHAVADSLRYLVINCRDELAAPLNRCLEEVEGMA